MARTKRKNTKSNRFLPTSIILLIAALICALVGKLDLLEASPVNVGYEDFAVHFVDVGQGDCVLVTSSQGNMLIDAGENGNEAKVISYLHDNGVESLDYVVATHPHSDHIGGMAEVIEEFEIKNVIMPKLSKANTPTTVTYEKMLTAIQNSGARVIAAKPNSSYTLGDVAFEVLAPFEQDKNLNNMSVVIRLTYGGHSFLFSGDAEKAVEKQLLKSGCDLSAEVYKLAHHGSSTSNSKAFVEAIDPDIAVISCGADNSYGHPHSEIVDLLKSEGIAYYRTDEAGSIVIGVDENNKLITECEK